jgi:hypothetical protein
MQTHHAKNLQTMSPEFWILPKEMLYFLFLWSWTENLSVMRKLNPLVQNEGWKKKKISTKGKWEYYYYLLVSNVEDAKCQPSQGCHNPSHNNDIVHQQKNIHETLSQSLYILWSKNCQVQTSNFLNPESKPKSESETWSSCCYSDSTSFHDDSCQHSFLLHKCHDGGMIFCMQILGYVSDHVQILLDHSLILIFLNVRRRIRALIEGQTELLIKSLQPQQ